MFLTEREIIMKKIRRLLCAIMAAATALAASVPVNAEENDNPVSFSDTSEAIGSTDSEGYVLISEEKYSDGEFFIVDRLYEYPGISTYASTTGTADYKKTRNIYNKGGVPSDDSSGTKIVTMWVSGTFKWDSDKDTATVSNVKAGFDDYSDSHLEVTTVDGYPKSASNQGATLLWGHKYAYIEYYINIRKIPTQTNHKFRLWLDVDINGDSHTGY